MKPTQIQGLHG